MSYFARFEKINGQLFRFDTRIYLTEFDPQEPSICVGAIVGKNPGSAQPHIFGELQPLDLNGDKMLPAVRNRFLDAYKIAQKDIPINAYVRVWNLFYLCDADLSSACNKIANFSNIPTCESEKEYTPIIWFGWGGSDNRLNSYKNRFISKTWDNQFYYSHVEKRVVNQLPCPESFAKHTQGMPSEPVNGHLSEII
ncbi:hypothetical protein ACLVXC_004225 [Vibrio alginolyticus]|uniref:hypothetical protein n=1 Tax=Vibrio TaxID=662 RepID=UPI001E2D53ED|nr:MULTISPECIES: hypothetical protein [unclassified Vibrio]EGQ9765679.1 hypothetical protein [Vibrio alginolyticus]EGR0722851.1 hypothetical protein [Vibrio alginolyticus]EJE3289578.1 hypothetical protein [Vibrio alginolyticus]EJN3357889.1 hypothetical protein [Vibrio alginolyticus]EJS0373186.1 hypothetical protein [Vibrio alginolyticus]